MRYLDYCINKAYFTDMRKSLKADKEKKFSKPLEGDAFYVPFMNIE